MNLIFSIIFPVILSAAISNNSGSDKINIFELKKKMLLQNKLIQEMNNEVNNVEMNLGNQNKRYLKLAESRQALEENLSRAKKNADLDNQGLKKSYNETKLVLMGIILNKLDKKEAPADLLTRKILIQNLEQKLVDLNGIIKTNRSIQAEVEKLNQRLLESLNTEKELISIMTELEQRKKELFVDLESENKKKNQAQIYFDEVKNKSAMERDLVRKNQLKEKLRPLQITEEIKIPSKVEIGINFLPPLLTYEGIEYQKKGVTFNFQGKNEVRAPSFGKVVYTGSLASYGNVIMIDHGNDTRTVLFGQFDYNVKNGDVVQAAQLVGYTNPRSTTGLGDGKIYFEVRRNNLAQNTYLLLDKKTLVGNSSK